MSFYYGYVPDALQEFQCIATKFIAIIIFRCNKTQYYHKISFCGNRRYILPQFRYVALSRNFVAIEARYCNKMHIGGNILKILPQFYCVALNRSYVAIAARYCNKMYIHGNILDILPQSSVVANQNDILQQYWLAPHVNMPRPM